MYLIEYLLNFCCRKSIVLLVTSGQRWLNENNTKCREMDLMTLDISEHTWILSIEQEPFSYPIEYIPHDETAVLGNRRSVATRVHMIQPSPETGTDTEDACLYQFIERSAIRTRRPASFLLHILTNINEIHSKALLSRWNFHRIEPCFRNRSRQ